MPLVCGGVNRNPGVDRPLTLLMSIQRTLTTPRWTPLLPHPSFPVAAAEGNSCTP